MSCNNECYAPGALPGPRPVTHSNNEPCVRPCPDSIAIIQPPPVAVTLPGPILSSFPQQTAVETLGPAGIGGLL
ncbi:unnamed protein product, partial [Lepidochelys olivacea]